MPALLFLNVAGRRDLIFHAVNYSSIALFNTWYRTPTGTTAQATAVHMISLSGHIDGCVGSQHTRHSHQFLRHPGASMAIRSRSQGARRVG